MNANPPNRSLPAFFAWWSGLLFVVVCVAYWWLVSYGTFRLNGEEMRGVAFDSLGNSLLHGRADVQPDTINWEGFDVNGKRYIHYGPLPAMLRIVPNLLFPSLYGKWSRPSCLLAAILCLWAFLRIVREALQHNGGLSAGARRLHDFAAILGFGLGTPLVYLVSCGRIYHEAVLWALCGALFSLLFLLRLDRGTIGDSAGLFLLSISFAVTLLTRLTFAVPAGLALALMFLVKLWPRVTQSAPNDRGRRALPLLLALAPAVLAVGIQLWYNHARFGSVWKAIDFAGNYMKPETLGGTFNLRRVPSALRNYVGWHGLADRLPPYFQLEKVQYANDALFFNWREHTFSLTLASSWLVLGALIGAFRIFFRRAIPWGRLLLLFYAVEVVTICAFYFVTQRYAAEFLPALALLYFAFLIQESSARPLSRLLPWLLLLLAILSSAITIGSTLNWNLMYNGDAPQAYKERLGRMFTTIPKLTPWSGREVPLNELTPVGETFQYRPYKNDTTWEGFPLAFKGFKFEHGIGMHANATLTYTCPAGATHFQAFVGLPDTVLQCDVASTTFALENEKGEVLYRSPVIRNGQAPLPVRVPLRGAETLTLAVGDAGDGINCDHGCWAAAEFLIPEKK